MKKKREVSFCRGCERDYPRDMFPLRKSRGGTIDHPYCKTCQSNRMNTGLNQTYRTHKSNICAICGFQGHPCQLDVNHKDADHKNNDPSNLETLCANCHRLVSYTARSR